MSNKEKYDFDSTFTTFFTDEPEADEQPARACTDCASEDNLQVLYPVRGGSVWICPDCKAARDAAQKASETREASRISTWAAMDEWEE